MPLGLILASTSILLTPLACGANNHGLYWGPEEGERIEYGTVTYWTLPYGFAASNERFYAVVDSLPPIPETVTELQDIPYPNVTLYWENGSEVGPWGVGPHVVPSPNSVLPPLLLPTGNWSLMTSLRSFPHGLELVENESVWGQRGGGEGPYTGTTQNMTILFLKSDGALLQSLYTIWNTTTEEEVYHIEVARLADETEPVVPLSLVAVVSMPVGVAVVVVLVRMDRH